PDPLSRRPHLRHPHGHSLRPVGHIWNEEPQSSTRGLHHRQASRSICWDERRLEAEEGAPKSLPRPDRSSPGVPRQRDSHGIEAASLGFRPDKWLRQHPNLKRINQRGQPDNQQETRVQTRLGLDHFREKPSIGVSTKKDETTTGYETEGLTRRDRIQPRESCPGEDSAQSKDLL